MEMKRNHSCISNLALNNYGTELSLQENYNKKPWKNGWLTDNDCRLLADCSAQMRTKIFQDQKEF